jgi:hypothetical protein
MSDIYKYRLLKDLPEYPKNTVFILDDGWRAYWDGGSFTIPKWLEELLYCNVPEVSDEMHDWFVPIIDSEQVRWGVDVLGNITEFTIYTFWGVSNKPNVFADKSEAEEKAEKIKAIFATPTQPNPHKEQL